MKISPALLRGAAMMAVGLAIFSTSVAVTTPGVEASVLEKKNSTSEKAGSGGISDVPIIGDLVGTFEGQEPEDIAVTAIQLGAGAAEIAVPAIIRAFK